MLEEADLAGVTAVLGGSTPASLVVSGTPEGNTSHFLSRSCHQPRL